MRVSDKSVVDAMLNPKSVAVIGASRREGSLGNTIMKKITGFGYTGKIYPVNPKRPQIMGFESYKSVVDVPGEIDTAVICVPGQFVNQVIKDLHKKNVRSCIIISAGFKEIGPEGVEREKELKKLTSEYGIRVIGPNCFGIINSSEDISIDCTFARNFAPRGSIGFISQSGAFGAAVNEDLRNTTMGLSLFISLGNRIDFNENEALQYLADHKKTRIILLYLENFADPREFVKIAKKITAKKPVVAIKAGKSKKAASAVASHTGQLAQSNAMVDAVLEKAGVIRVDSVQELIFAAKALYPGFVPEKEKLAIISNTGGFGVMSIDRAEEVGVELAEFSPKTRKFLEDNLPQEASCKNPVDLLGTATEEDYAVSLQGVLEDPDVGGVVCNFGPPVMQKAEPIAEKIAEFAQKHPDKLVMSVFMNRNRIMESLRDTGDVYVSQFLYPEDAVWAYSKLLQYRKIRERKEGRLPDYEFDAQTVKNILDRAKQEGRTHLDFKEAERVVSAFGIPVAKSVLIKPGDKVEEKLSLLNFPVAVKPDWGEISHKSDIKAVELNLNLPEEVSAAMADIGDRIAKHTGKPYRHGFLVQEIAKGNKEVIIGCVRQDSSLHLVMFGLGGIFVELLKDVSFAVAPVDDIEAERMIKKIKGYPLLSGFRGEKGVDLEQIKQVLMRISQLVTVFNEIKELDVNPFIASSQKGESAAVDVRIIL